MMKISVLATLIIAVLLIITTLIYFLHPSLLWVVIIIALFTVIGCYLILKYPQIQKRILLSYGATFSSLAKDFLYPKLLILVLVMPVIASEMGNAPIIFISGIIFAVVVLILFLYEIPKSNNIKKLFFWILFSLIGLVINIHLFYMSLK